MQQQRSFCLHVHTCKLYINIMYTHNMYIWWCKLQRFFIFHFYLLLFLHRTFIIFHQNMYTPLSVLRKQQAIAIQLRCTHIHIIAVGDLCVCVLVQNIRKCKSVAIVCEGLGVAFVLGRDGYIKCAFRCNKVLIIIYEHWLKAISIKRH